MTLRKFKNTLRDSEKTRKSVTVIKFKKLVTVILYRFKYVKIFKHAILYVNYFERIEKVKLKRFWCQIVLENGGKYGL